MSDRALVHRLDCIIGVWSSGMQVVTHLAFPVSPIGQHFSSGGQAECCIVSPELPNWRGVARIVRKED